MALTPNEVLAQSKAAFRQWEEIWKENARINGEIYKRNKLSQQDLLYSGAGKKLLCIAYAPSFENQIENVQKYKNDAVDIACVDKAMGKLIDNNISPKFVVIADAGINYKKWCEPWIDKTKDIILIANITANIEWTQNWQGKVYFYVNKDNIQSEKIFSDISGCNEVIPASSNVGNTVVVFAAQVLGYDEYLLLGYDYCWGDKDNYYAFKDSEKRYWMKHINLVDLSGRLVNTSQNLLFSSRWLSDYYSKILRHQTRIYNCSGQGILRIPEANLIKKLKNAKIRQLHPVEKHNIMQAK